MAEAINRSDLKAELDMVVDSKFLHPAEVKVIIAAARAHLATLPKTKTVKVWAIDWALKYRAAFTDHAVWCLQQTIVQTKVETDEWLRRTHGNPEIRCMKIAEVEREIPDED